MIAMTYVADLGQGQTLAIENARTQTVITWETKSAGQQQSQQMSLSLGQWSASPIVFRMSFGFILQIESNQRAYYIRLQANSISLLSEVPLMLGAQEISLRNVAASSMKVSEIKPLEPLRMGNMSMQMEPMQMSMGEMKMSMATSSSSSSAIARYCRNCGREVGDRDRFCSQCGAKLS
ncbi:zinc ribbon domain-containing protein [Leptolyngbya sp. DQ-M1]|uniref:zinc ribbon domain-containing protein n=1 Tax=Leptolyngbya sp. DQ-M1 TaxID=2933920 RepID=UPI00329A7809